MTKNDAASAAANPAEFPNSQQTALVEIRCPVHGPTMEQRDPAKQTYEQRYCGALWQCTRCTNSVLFPSVALRLQLAEMVS